MTTTTGDQSNFYNERRYEKVPMGKLFVVPYREAETSSRAFAKARLRAGKLIADKTPPSGVQPPSPRPTQPKARKRVAEFYGRKLPRASKRRARREAPRWGTKQSAGSFHGSAIKACIKRATVARVTSDQRHV